MQILRDRPSADLAYAIKAPLFVSGPEGERIGVESWSMRGFNCAGLDRCDPTERLKVTVHFDFQGYEISAPVDVEALGGGSFEFVDLAGRTRDLIEQFATDIMHGRMTPTGDALLRLDTPEDPISVEPDAPQPGDSNARRSLRPLIMTVFYVLMGFVVFGYVGILIHTNFVKLEVQTAVVSRPVEVLAMPVDGHLAALRTSAGSRVRSGDLLAVVSDPDLDARIDQHRITLASAKAMVRRLRQTIDVERSRLEQYRVINRTDAAIAQAEVIALTEDRERTAQHLSRLRTLHHKGHATDTALEDARAADALAASRVAAARLMADRTAVLDGISETRHHNGREFIVDLDLLAVELAAAKQAEDEAAARLAVLLERRAALALAAPFDARVLEVIHAPDTPLLRGASLITLEHDIAPVVIAFLDQEEVLEIGLGDPATIFLPAHDRKIPATVAQIDRTTGFVDEQESRYVWRGPNDRSARIVLKIADRDLRSGLPAIVLFNRRGTNTVGRDLVDRLPVPSGNV